MDEDKLCLGYVEIAREGDLGPEDECPECGYPIGSPAYIAIYSDGTVAGPLCSRCATST